MPNTAATLTAVGEAYFTDLARVRASGGATGERSSYGPLANLLNAVGATLTPPVFCVGELADQGAGHPDFGLYAAKQVQQGRPRAGQVPERGVVEVKAAGDDAWLTAAGDQVSRYWERYRLVLVTNTRGGRNMTSEDFAVTAGWGHYGTGDAVMPGQGRIVERVFTLEERAAMSDALPALGETTVDIYLNARTCWRNVPAAVWTYKLGGYQVLKKWLSYREREMLGRALTPEDVQHFTDTARRIGAILNGSQSSAR